MTITDYLRISKNNTWIYYKNPRFILISVYERQSEIFKMYENLPFQKSICYVLKTGFELL